MTRQKTSPIIALLVSIILAAACTPDGPQRSPTPSPDPSGPINCRTIRATVPDLTCIDAGEGLLMQLSDGTDTQTVALGAVSLTFTDTVYLYLGTENQMMVMVLAGTGIVGAANTTRILQTGQQTTVPIAQGLAASDSPSLPEPVDIGLVGGLPYLMLPREITRLEPFAQATSPGSTAPPNIASTEESTGACPPSDGWTALYTVASGDTLSEIAAEYDVTVAELQEANCIDDPNRISPDQTLRVPPLPVEDTPAGQTIFTPDRDTIPRGECTTLTWDVADASLVYYQGDPVAHSASQEVCPLTTTTYTLLVIYSDGGQTGFTASVTVTDPP